MGGVKQEYLDYYTRGYSKPPEKFVCKNHFTDETIIDFIEENSIDGICDYCKLRYQDGKVIPLELLVGFINSGIRYFYGEPGDEGVGYDSSEGGWLGTEIYDSYELLQDEIGLEIDEHSLFLDIHDCFSDYQWCQIDPYALPENQEMNYDWERFCRLVKHKIRYSFFASKVFDLEYKEFASILHDISRGVETLNLIKQIEIGSKIFRGRQHKETESPNKFKDLSSPPERCATYPNRMSPAGISMFYGAFEETTAAAEVFDKNQIVIKPLITIGEFSVSKKLFIIDFTDLPPIPSIFDKEHRNDYYMILFFHSFIENLSQDIKRDNRIHIDYVPTQILTEYFRYVLPEYSPISIDGLIYKSSKNITGKCCVLFFDNEESKEYLELMNTKIIKPSC